MTRRPWGETHYVYHGRSYSREPDGRRVRLLAREDSQRIAPAGPDDRNRNRLAPVSQHEGIPCPASRCDNWCIPGRHAGKLEAQWHQSAAARLPHVCSCVARYRGSRRTPQIQVAAPTVGSALPAPGERRQPECANRSFEDLCLLGWVSQHLPKTVKRSPMK